MKKIQFFFVGMAMVFLHALAFAGSEEIVEVKIITETEVADRVYFDSQFDKLHKSVSEVKGDTSQIVEILSSVFEGTVPSGGTLTGLCNKHGWNLIVLMGHNNVSNPDVVAAKDKFTYPKTPQEFQVALKKGKPLYHEWLKTQSKTFRVNRIAVDTVAIDKLNVRVAKFTEKLEVKDMEIDTLTIRVAEITEKLTVKEAAIGTLRVENAKIGHLKIRLAELDELRIRLLAVNEVLIEKLRINQLQLAEESRAKIVAQERAQVAESRPPEVRVQTQTVYADMPALVGMRINVAGEGRCDHNPFPPGIVSTDVMEATNGRGGDVIEVIFDEKTGMRHAKRLHTNPDGWSYVYQWINPNGAGGDCVWLFQKDDMFTIEQLQQLLRAGESLVPRMVSEMDHDYWGREMTEGTFLVHKVGDAPVTE